MYTVQWKNTYGEWQTISNTFMFYWSAKRFVGKRIVTLNSAKEWRILSSLYYFDPKGLVRLHIKRLI